MQTSQVVAQQPKPLSSHVPPFDPSPRTLRNLSLGLAMELLKAPSGETSEKALSSAPRGTLTLSNHSFPLSTPVASERENKHDEKGTEEK